MACLRAHHIAAGHASTVLLRLLNEMRNLNMVREERGQVKLHAITFLLSCSSIYVVIASRQALIGRLNARIKSQNSTVI